MRVSSKKRGSQPLDPLLIRRLKACAPGSIRDLLWGLIGLMASAILAGCGADDKSTPTLDACTPMRRFSQTSFGTSSQAKSQRVAQANARANTRADALADALADAMTLSLAYQVPSHIPQKVQSLADAGKLPDSEILPITIALALNHEDELDQRIQEIYQPGSSSYHRFMTPLEFKERYSPTQEQIQKAQAYLHAQGVTHQSVNPNGYLIEGQISASNANSAFNTELRRYRDAQGNPYFSASIEPKLPKDLSIRAVHGLHNLSRFRSFSVKSSAVQAQAGSGPFGGLSPSDIQSAYGFPSQLNGAGQTLALVEFDGYNPSDIEEYERFFGLPSVPLQNILVSGASGAAGASAGEVTLDIELMIAVAPGVSKIQVYEAPNSDQAVLALYSRIANDNTAQIVSTSWGQSEAAQSTSFLVTENSILKQMAVQGQSVFAASGDAGAYDNRSNISVSDPASQPFVVAVGGTTLSTRGGSYVSETTWNGGSPSAGAGGGGVSTLWAQPSWQSGVISSQARGSTQMRNLPDVSLNADPGTGYSIYLQGSWTTIGGTSAAAPIWAAYTALVNQQRRAHGLASLGFVNPHLYSIGRSKRYTPDFHDISDGSTNLYFPAVPGFDDATGWGTPQGQNLFEDLSTDPSSSAGAVSC